MADAVGPTLYTAFGLSIRSELRLTELPQTIGKTGAADVEIELGDLSAAWRTYGDPDDYYAYLDGQFLFHVPDVAIYSIRGGKHIVVSPFAGAEEQSLRVYLLGTCMGAILMQRRTLPLHGSAVVIDGQAYAFVGESGAGKSTLAAAFRNRGYRLLSDDVIAVTVGADGNTPIVIPAYPQQKLWQASIDQLGMESDAYRRLYLSKFAIPVDSGFANEAVPLAGVFELTKTEGAKVELSDYQGLERLAILRMHTYRDFLIPHLAGEDWHFSTVAGMASRVGMYRLRRPTAGFSAHELVDRVLRTVLEDKKAMNG